MPQITADFIFDGYTFLPKGSVLSVSADGEILETAESAGVGDIVRYKGLLMPGMVNTHCHLELSHLKKKVAEKKGLVTFLLSVLSDRGNYAEAEKQTAIEDAEAEMIRNGIAAVGDICNTTDTIFQKKKKNILYHSFVECFGLKPEKAAEIFTAGCKIRAAFEEQGNSSLVLHAPYSVSNELIRKIDEASAGKITTIHNQESGAENELFLHRRGSFLQLFDAIHVDPELFETENKNSIQTYLPKFIHQQKIILVHNTFTSEEDIAFVQALQKEIYWCLCPNANMFIENTLPDIAMMLRLGCKIVLGTDSLASNHALNLWEEIRTIKNLHPEIPLQTMLQWATSNGAEALGLQGKTGSFEKGRSPGIFNISNFTCKELLPDNDLLIERIA